MAQEKSPILQGTLDLMVLKTLDQMGPLHGYGIGRRIEQVGPSSLNYTTSALRHRSSASSTAPELGTAASSPR